MSWNYRISNRPSPLTQAQMAENVDEIYAQLYSNYLWTVNAICAVLGNMEKESYLNPAQTELYYPIDSNEHGYGLVQWDPARKYKNWARANNHSIYSGYWQVYFLNNQSGGTEWIPTTHFPETYDQFKHSGQTLSYLTECFLRNYERASVATEDLESRIEYANKWYRYIMGTDPPPEPTPEPPYPPEPPTPPDPDPSGYKRTSKINIYLRNPRLRF